MPSVFNIVRACIYVAVLVWTIICLAIAAHFQSMLVSSDLTRFVPFAIFVCSASLLLIVALLGFGFWRDRNPISTRVELGCLGLVGVLWLALGAFLGSSDSGDSDVECFSSADSASEPTEVPGFNTETFHAQYRVLEAFSFFNIILIWAFLLMLLFLAIRQHRWGNRQIWLESVTAFPWFAGRDAQTGKLPALPAPVTHDHKRSASSRSQAQVARGPSTRDRERERERDREMRERQRPRDLHRQGTGGSSRRDDRAERPNGLQEKRPSQHRRPSETRRDSPTRNEVPTYVFNIPHTTPDRAYVGDNTRRPRDRYYDQERSPPRR